MRRSNKSRPAPDLGRVAASVASSLRIEGINVTPQALLKSVPAKKKPVNSRAKGARGELQLAAALTALGHPAQRGQQHSGGADSPDVICESLDVHWEVKLYGTCQIFSPSMIKTWSAQAVRDAGPGKLPVIAHRWLRSDWWCCVLRPGLNPLWLRLEHLIAEIDAGLWVEKKEAA